MELNKSNDKQLNVTLFTIGALVLTYTGVRAYLLAITWDEAYTYIEYARNGKVILSNYDMMSANNHILNTFLMIVFTKLFGVSEFVMRMPPLIAHFLFLFFSARLLKHLDNKWLVVTAFIVVNINPYMLDFFSVARGYGLSLGLMMTSIYYFYLFHNRENKNKYAFIALLMAGLAVLANFVLLNYCVVLFGLIILLYFYYAGISNKPAAQKFTQILRGIAVPSILMILLFLFVVPIALKLKDAGALFFGGEAGFWKDTVNTITDRSLYEIGYNYWLQRFLKGFVFLIVISSVVLVAVKFIKRQISDNTLFLSSLLLLIGLCSLSTIVQHHLLETPYLLDRTALFLVVLFNLIFAFFISELVKNKNVFVLIAHLSSVIVVIHFFAAFNLTYVLEWKLDANTKEMLTDLEKIKEIPKGKETVSIGIPLIFDPAINFYREKNNLTWLNSAWRYETTNMLQDYFCLSQREMSKINTDSIEIIKTYPVTQNVFAKRKYAQQINPMLQKTMSFENEDNKRFVINENVEYGPAFSYIVNDSITPGKRAVFAFYADVMAPDMKKDNLVMVISFQDASGKLYSWQKAYVKDFIKNESDWFRTNFTCIVPAETKDGDELKAYIWNPDKHLLYIKQMEFKWLEYKN